jgi:hypothetical protein
LNELRESLKELFANLNEMEGGGIGIDDPAKLQTVIEAVNGVSANFLKAKSETKEEADRQLLALSIASDINNLLKAV